MTTGGVLHFLSNDGSRSDANQSRNHIYHEVTDACVPARNKELSDLALLKIVGLVSVVSDFSFYSVGYD
jgi:hypothetical protein